jgi:hypothetical protein
MKFEEKTLPVANCEDLNRPEQMRKPWFLISFLFFFFYKV